MAKTLRTIGRIASIAATASVFVFGPVSPITLALSATAAVASIGAQVLAKPPPARGSIAQMLIAPDAPRPYPMGGIHFGGVLRHRTGYGGTVDDVENPYLFDVVVYSGVGPIQSITPQIDFAAIPGWYTGFLTTDTQLGEMPEAAALTGSFGTPTGWGAAYKLSGHAAVAWNMKFDKKGKKFANGIPLTGALMEGVKVYDPRLDDTFPGGAGAHRVNDETTWEYSDNPALHAGTYAYGRYAEGVKVMGVGLPVEGIDFSSVAAWANVCETNDWTISGVAFEPGDRWQNLKDICAAGSGEPIFAGAVLSFRYDAPVVALDTVTEADVLDGMGVTFMQSWRDRLNTIVPKYRSADHNWEMVSAEAVIESDLVLEDGEERREEWPFNFVKEKDQAAQLAAYKIWNSRELHPIRLHGMPRLRFYRPGECLHLTLPRLGLDTDAVIVERQIDPATMTVELTLIGETDAKHAYALGLTGTAPPTPALGQDAEDRDTTASDNSRDSAIEVANEAALIALGGPYGQVAKRTDTGESYSHNGGTSGTIADWTLIGTTILTGDLAAIEALTGTGFPARLAADTWALRQVLGTANEISSTNPAGVAGDVTLSLPAAMTLTGKTLTGGTFSGPTITLLDTGFTIQDNLDPTKQAVFQLSGVTAATTRTLIVPDGSGIIAVSAVAPISLGATGQLTWNGGDLTRVNDTNVTLTLGGTPANALANNVSITVGWSGTLSVARGGTGAGTLTGLLQGNGTSAVTVIANSSTVGQTLRVTGASTYAWGALDLADTDAVTGTLPVANGGTGVTSSTGSTSVVLSASPTLTGTLTAATANFSGVVTVSNVLSTLPASNKRIISAAPGSSGITDFSTGGAAWLFSRPSDGTDGLSALFHYATAGSVQNLAMVARGNLVFGTGGGGTYTACLERLRITDTAVNMASGVALQANGTQVVSTRKTGWSAMTGTAARTAAAVHAAQTISNPPTQAEVQNIDNSLVIVAQRLKALIDDMHGTAGHGLIGT